MYCRVYGRSTVLRTMRDWKKTSPIQVPKSMNMYGCAMAKAAKPAMPDTSMPFARRNRCDISIRTDALSRRGSHIRSTCAATNAAATGAAANFVATASPTNTPASTASSIFPRSTYLTDQYTVPTIRVVVRESTVA